MSNSSVDFSKNFLNLKYSVEHNCLSFASKADKNAFIKLLDEMLLNSPLLKVNCGDKTFSASDNASSKFIESDFYMNMLDSLDYSRNEDIIKNMKGFKKIDINRDAYYDKDRIILRRLKRFCDVSSLE